MKALSSGFKEMFGSDILKIEIKAINENITAICKLHGKYTQFFYKEGVRYAGICTKCREDAITAISIKKSSIPKSDEHCSFDNFDTSKDLNQKKYLSFVKEWAENFDGNSRNSAGMFLIGSTGSGKNHLATAAIKKIAKKGFSCHIETARDLLKKHHGIDNSVDQLNWLKEMANIDLLVIDELDKAPKTVSSKDTLFDLINKRAGNLKTTCILGNISSKESIFEIIGEEGYTRVIQYGGRVCFFNWTTYR